MGKKLGNNGLRPSWKTVGVAVVLKAVVGRGWCSHR